MFGNELVMLCDAITRDAKNLSTRVGKGLKLFRETDGFLGTARRIIAGIEKQDNGIAAQRRQAYLTPAVARQGEIGAMSEMSGIKRLRSWFVTGLPYHRAARAGWKVWKAN